MVVEAGGDASAQERAAADTGVASEAESPVPVPATVADEAKALGREL